MKYFLKFSNLLKAFDFSEADISFNTQFVFCNLVRGCAVRVPEHRHKLPTEVLEPFPMEVVKACLDAHLCDLLQGAAPAGGLNSVISWAPSQPSVKEHRITE